jgi:hypothetical protein
MRSPKINLDQPSEAIDAAEARMRLALGLDTRPGSNGQSKSGSSHGAAPQQSSHDSARPRRRFAQDGDVPVVILGRSRDGEAGGEGRFAALTAELRDEKAARIRADRALDEAGLSIQSLKTKLAHLEIACEERLRDERAASAQSDAQRAAEHDARTKAETRTAETALALSIAERRIAELEEAIAIAASQSETVIATDLFGPTEAAQPARRQARRKTRGVEPESETESNRDSTVATEVEAVTAVTIVAEANPEAGTEEQPIEWWLPSFRAQRNATVNRKRKTR